MYEIDIFEKQYQKVNYRADPIPIFKMYTAETLVYKVINNLSRVSSDSLEMYYIQALIKDLREGIKYLYQKQAKK